MIVHFGVAASQADYARAVQFRDVRPSVLRSVETMQLPAEFAPDDRVPVMILRSGPQIDLLKWSIPDQRTGAPRLFVPGSQNYAYRGLVAISYFDAEFDDGDGPVLARFTAADGGMLLLAATWKPGKYGFDQCFALLLQRAGAGMPSGCHYQPVLSKRCFQATRLRIGEAG